jgi:hypothetical protein
MLPAAVSIRMLAWPVPVIRTLPSSVWSRCAPRRYYPLPTRELGPAGVPDYR